MNNVASVEQIFDVLQDRFFGKYRGIVMENTDTENRGRLQVKVPTVMGDQLIWALPCVNYAGDGVGLYAMPPVDAGVWVEFEGGDPNFPIWVGCFWGDGQIPDEDAKPSIKFWRTEGISIRIDDDEGSLTIDAGNGTILTINTSEMKLEASEISQSANGASHKLSAAGLNVNNGAFEVS